MARDEETLPPELGIWSVVEEANGSVVLGEGAFGM